MFSNLSTTTQLCVPLCLEAGRAILLHYGTEKSTAKSDGSPLTVADEAANRILCEGLAAAFPGVPIVSEESPDDGTRQGSEWCFLVDPLDGTKEFLSGNGEFTVNVALIQNGRPVMGVVYAPALDDLYFAWEGGGAWWQRYAGTPVRIAATHAPVPPRLTVSRSHRSPEEDGFIAEHGVVSVLPMGSSLKGCLVARGEADLYLRAGTVMEWDIAAMQAVVVEAGGSLVRWGTQEPVLYNRGESLKVNGFVCSGLGTGKTPHL